MPVLQESGILDLIKSTRKDEGEGKYNQIAQSLQNYEFWKRILKSAKEMIEGGTSIQRQLMTGLADSVSMVGLAATDDTEEHDIMAQLEVPWRRATGYVQWEIREFLENKYNNKKIYNILNTKRQAGEIAWAVKMESQWWTKPTNSSDTLNSFGVQYWVPWVASVAGGFSGGNPSGFTGGAGGLPVATYPNAQNYTRTYTNMNATDGLAKIRTAMDLTNFQSPVDIEDYRRKGSAGQMFRLYCNQSTKQLIEDAATAQNDNNGRIIGNFDGVTTVRSSPLVYVPYLDANSTNTDPVYGLNFNWFTAAFLEGDFMRKTEARAVYNQHNVIREFTDCSFNFVCTDRRQQFVIAKS